MSTHAKSDPTHYSLSTLYLSGNPIDSIRSYQLKSLNLEPDLVLLDGCETSLGETQKGEGVLSLTRSFALLGSTCTGGSLWQVNHAATEQIYTSFYTHLSEGVSVAKAMQMAKMDYLTADEVNDQTAHPYFWSGIVLTGNASLVIEGTKSYGVAWGIAVLLLVALLALLFIFKQNQNKTKNTL